MKKYFAVFLLIAFNMTCSGQAKILTGNVVVSTEPTSFSKVEDGVAHYHLIKTDAKHGYQCADGSVLYVPVWAEQSGARCYYFIPFVKNGVRFFQMFTLEEDYD